MRVCHVISGDLWAGAETMCLRLLTGLGGMPDVERSAILLNEGRLSNEVRNLGIPMAVVDETTTGFLRAVRRVRETVREFRPDVLHTHRLKENILGYLSAGGAGKGIPLVCTQHGLDEPQLRLKWRLLSAVNRHLMSAHFRYVVAVSEDVRDALSGRNGIPGGKVVVIHNGTDVRSHAPGTTGDRPFTIGSAGRLFPVKDYPLLVDVAAEICRHAGNVRFELAGEGPEFEKVAQRVRNRGLEGRFTMKGFVENMPEFYRGLDLYINTSLHEGFPMSVLEAMAHGLPVVAPAGGGIREAVADGVHGYLVDGRDPGGFARRCHEICRDPELRSRMGAACREKVAGEFSIRAMAERYMELYRASVS